MLAKLGRKHFHRTTAQVSRLFSPKSLKGGLPIPGPVWRAYEVLLAQLAASDRAGIWTPVPAIGE